MTKEQLEVFKWLEEMNYSLHWFATFGTEQRAVDIQHNLAFTSSHEAAAVSLYATIEHATELANACCHLIAIIDAKEKENGRE